METMKHRHLCFSFKEMANYGNFSETLFLEYLRKFSKILNKNEVSLEDPKTDDEDEGFVDLHYQIKVLVGIYKSNY